MPVSMAKQVVTPAGSEAAAAAAAAADSAAVPLTGAGAETVQNATTAAADAAGAAKEASLAGTASRVGASSSLRLKAARLQMRRSLLRAAQAVPPVQARPAISPTRWAGR